MGRTKFDLMVEQNLMRHGSLIGDSLMYQLDVDASGVDIEIKGMKRGEDHVTPLGLRIPWYERDSEHPGYFMSMTVAQFVEFASLLNSIGQEIVRMQNTPLTDAIEDELMDYASPSEEDMERWFGEGIKRLLKKYKGEDSSDK